MSKTKGFHKRARRNRRKPRSTMAPPNASDLRRVARLKPRKLEPEDYRYDRAVIAQNVTNLFHPGAYRRTRKTGLKPAGQGQAETEAIRSNG
jgi:hypothetical protein